MRIGRNLTVTEIDNRITNYNENYELSDAQIAALLANVNAGIGQLACLLGINALKFPLLYIRRSSVSIPHNTWTVIEWDALQRDYLDAWDDAKPTEILLKDRHFYEITMECEWADNSSGMRAMNMDAVTFPKFESHHSAANGGGKLHLVSGVLEYAQSGAGVMQVFQSSGGALTLTTCALIIVRRSLQLAP